MRRTQPLQAHPEFTILDHPNCREFRVENWRLARDGSNKILKFYGWSWLDLILPVIFAVLWEKLSSSHIYSVAAVIFLIVYAHSKCTQILWESVLAIPCMGIQLETHRGLPHIPLFTSRRFIPLIYLQDFIINEGLRRWDVRYYLAAIQQSDSNEISLKVAYENILPYFPILLEVYHGLHDVMFDTPGQTNIPK